MNNKQVEFSLHFISFPSSKLRRVCRIACANVKYGTQRGLKLLLCFCKFWSLMTCFSSSRLQSLIKGSNYRTSNKMLLFGKKLPIAASAKHILENFYFFSKDPYFLKFGHLLYRVQYFPVDFWTEFLRSFSDFWQRVVFEQINQRDTIDGLSNWKPRRKSEKKKYAASKTTVAASYLSLLKKVKSVRQAIKRWLHQWNNDHL